MDKIEKDVRKSQKQYHELMHRTQDPKYFRKGYDTTRGPLRTFTRISNSIINDVNLSSQEFRLYCKLLQYGQSTGKCWPPQTHLAGSLNLSVKQIRRLSRSLNHKGYIKIKKERRHFIYELLKLD